MQYPGQIAVIPFGDGALQSDDPQTKILTGRLISALNVSFHRGVAEKEGGSRRWNSSALPAGVIQFSDYWPTPILQRVIAVCSNGKVYRMPNYYTQAEVTAAGSAPATLSVSGFLTMIKGGEEEAGNSKKLFIMTGSNPIQVIEGDGTTRRDITAGASDWTGINQPFAGVVHGTRLFAWGNQNDRHRVYASASGDHEDFTGTPMSFSIYPGEGETLTAGFVFREKFFIMKRPSGLYVLDDSSTNSADWHFVRSTSSFGGISPHCVSLAFDDVLIGNEYGSITSLQAAQTFGDLLSSDLFHLLRIQEYAKNEVRADGYNNRQAVYYKGKKTVLFTFQSQASTRNDRIVSLHYRTPQEVMASWSDKDQPNCLVIKKDQNGIERPAYGADDGFIYEMDTADYWVGDGSDGLVQTAYSFEVQTPHMDFGELGPQVSEAQKQYDFLDVVFLPTGKFNVNIDVFVDGRLLQTINCDLSCGRELGVYRLDDASVDPTVPQSRQFPLNCSGKRISFRCYNDNAGENVKLVKLKVYCKVSVLKVDSQGKG